MADLQIHQFPCLSDNYGVLIKDGAAVASIDAPDAGAVKQALAEKGWRLTHILTTHHHADHIGGNLALKGETGCVIVGPKAEAARIPGIDKTVAQGDSFTFGGFQVRVFDTPGHTAGHISYWLPQASVAFVGDTLFAMGCGRVIEGAHETMWQSLCKIMQWPPETRLYCGHEYTVVNGKFALTVEPDNIALQKRVQEAEALRAAGKPTLPTSVGRELETNPFLRPHVAAIQQRLGMAGKPEWQIFGEIRERKNRA
ncbi:MAG: hydroxyacylglutathione hydrolase [Hyphomicrobiaceae bacterium]